MTTPNTDFVKYLNSVTTGTPANMVASEPLVYNSGTGRISIQPASTTIGGYVSKYDQTFGGIKKFANEAIFLGDVEIDGKTYLVNTTQSTDTLTGSVITTGGIGVAKNVNIGGTLTTPTETITSTINAINTLTGAVVVAGGMGISKDLYVGGSIHGTIAGTITQTSLVLSDTTQSTNTSSGTLVVNGGAGIGKDVYIGGITNNTYSRTTNWSEVYGALYSKYTADSTSYNTGGFQCLGGVGIAKNVNVGGSLNVTNNITGGTNCTINGTNDSTDTNTGALFVSGGGNIRKTMRCSSTIDSSGTSTGSLICHGGIGCAQTIYCNNMHALSNIFGLGEYLTNSDTIQLMLRYDTSGTKQCTFQASSAGNLEITTYATGGGSIKILDTTQSTSSSSGSMIINGGAGIAKDLYVGGNQRIISTIDTTSTDSGSLIIGGGIGIQKSVYIGGELYINSQINGLAKARIYGADTQLIAGANSTNYLYISCDTSSNCDMGVLPANSGNINISAGTQLKIATTTQSSGTSTGCVLVAGGIGIAKNTNIGGILKVLLTTESTNVSTGSVIISGGVAIAKNTTIGGTVNVGGNMTIVGSIAKGSGSCIIDNPNIVKRVQYEQQGKLKLGHCFVETPTAGTNIYEYKVTTTNCTASIKLPSYYKYFNENTKVYISPSNVLGYGYGNIDSNEDYVNITTNVDGEYNVLVTGSRKDQLAQNWWLDHGGTIVDGLDIGEYIEPN